MITDNRHRCHYDAVDLHEPLTRARGGSITDVNNSVTVCRACHDWIHAHPAKANELRLLLHAWEIE